MVKKIKETSVEFIRSYPQKTRELIDYISGIIFFIFPNVKENVINRKLKYVDSNIGSLCSIYIELEFLILEFKSGEKLKFKDVKSVDKMKIISILESLRK